MCMYMCVYLCWKYLAFYVFKPNEDRSIKFYTQYQIYVLISPGFDENPKTGSGVGKIRNEARRGYLKNGSNNFLQTRYLNTFLLDFQNVYNMFATEKQVKV